MSAAPGSAAGIWEQGTREAAHDRAAAAFVQHLVAMATGVPAHEVMTPTRGRGRAADARAMAMYLAHVALGWPQSRVAAAFRRDRTTISSACIRVEAMRDQVRIDEALSSLEACVRQAPTGIIA